MPRSLGTFLHMIRQSDYKSKSIAFSFEFCWRIGLYMRCSMNKYLNLIYCSLFILLRSY